MSTRCLFLAFFLLSSWSASGADAVFSADGKHLWINLRGDSVGDLEIGEHSGGGGVRPVSVSATGTGPKMVQSIALSKSGNLLLAGPDTVWAFNPATSKTVRVASLPAGFAIGDIAYQITTGAVFVSGSFVRADHTVERVGAFRIAKGSDKPEPVYLTGLDDITATAFDEHGNLFLSTGPDLWGGEIVATEHGQTPEYAWQFRGFRLAALGTPVSGEGSEAGQVISSLAAGASWLTLTLRGSEGGTLARVPIPSLKQHSDGAIDRLLPLKERWAFEHKLLGALQLLTPPNKLPPLPTVAVSPDLDLIAYQTAATGVRQWWLMTKGGKPRLLNEESD